MKRYTYFAADLYEEDCGEYVLYSEAQARIHALGVVKSAAESLREAQRDYMANRGNDEKGKAVAAAALALDEALAADVV